MPQTDARRTEAAPRARLRRWTELRAAASHTRLRWWTELPLLVMVYASYSAGKLLARGDTDDAVGHGLEILRIEKVLHLNAEHPLNRLFTREAWLGVPADFWYASLHYLVTPAILIWLFRSRAVRYRAARTWLMTSTLIGLIGFTLMPTCPPRLLSAGHGFVDTMAQYSSYGWWGGEASAARPRRHDQPVRGDAQPARGLVAVVRSDAVALRPHARRPARGHRLSAADHDRRDGHRQPLLPRRGGGRRRDGDRAAADPVRDAARGPRAGAAECPHPVDRGRLARRRFLNCQWRMPDFHG